MDSKKNPISKNDTVKIISGDYKGKKGVIYNIFKNYVFLYNVDYPFTNNIIVDRAENIEIMGSELLHENMDFNNTSKVNERRVPGGGGK